MCEQSLLPVGREGVGRGGGGGRVGKGGGAGSSEPASLQAGGHQREEGKQGNKGTHSL